MEDEPQIRSETPVSFPPYRRRPLQSETQRILFRILSHCYDVSQQLSDSGANQDEPPEVNQDNVSNDLEDKAEKEGDGDGDGGLVEADGAAARQEWVADERCDAIGLGIEQIEDLFTGEGNEEFSRQMDLDLENINFGDLEIGAEMLMEELEQIVNGNDDNATKPSAGSVIANEGVNKKVELVGNQVQNVDSQHKADQAVSGETLNEGEYNECSHSLLKSNALDVEPIIRQVETSVCSGGAEGSPIPITEVSQDKGAEYFSQEVPGALGFSLDNDMVGALNPSEGKGISSSPKANDLEEEHEMQPKESEMEMVCTMDTVDSPNHMNDEDIEEGEISDDYDGMDDRSTNMVLLDTVRSEENKEVQILKDVNDPREHFGEEAIARQFDSNSFLRSIADNVQNPRELRGRESKPISIPVVVQGEAMEATKEGGSGCLLESQRTEEKDSRIGRGVGFPEACINTQASHEKISENNEAGNYGATYEHQGGAGAPNKRKKGPPSKEKKQRKKAKERLKRADMNRKEGVKRLKLHLPEKPKTVRHCRHYVVGRCHEGDKCKFSHDTVPLTKSKPCSHFACQKCMKGDECPYDHELSKYPCNNFVEKGSCRRGDECLFSHKIISKEEGASATSKLELVPPSMRSSSRSAQVRIGSPSQKNLHALPHSTGTHSHNNTEMIMARNLLEQPTMSTKGFSFLSTGKPSLVHSSMSKQEVWAPDRNTGAKAGNLMLQSPSSSFPNTKENLITTPLVVTPKGINFLSFGKAPADGSSGKNQDHHQHPSVTETGQNFNVSPKVIQPAQPKAADILSVGKDPLGNSSGGNPFSLTSTSDYGNSVRSIEGKSVFDNSLNSSAISSRLLPSPHTSGQSSDYSASRFKDKGNQRALFSTLAFAAKYESKKTNQSIGSTFKQADQETKQNDSAKAFNILDFLSSIGSTTKQ